MREERDLYYFEPRVVVSRGISWYGRHYYSEALSGHYGKTVYVRDNGTQLFIYTIDGEDDRCNPGAGEVSLTLRTSIDKMYAEGERPVRYARVLVDLTRKIK